MIIYNSGIIEHVIHLSDTLKLESDIDGYAIDRPQTVNNYIELNAMKPILTSTSTVPSSHLNNQVIINTGSGSRLIMPFSSHSYVTHQVYHQYANCNIRASEFHNCKLMIPRHLNNEVIINVNCSTD